MTDGVRTEVTPTHLGDVDYEVVECASCGSDVLKREATRYAAGDLKEKTVWRGLDKVKIEFDTRGYIDGWLCPYCMDEGPISLPKPSLAGRFSRFWNDHPGALLFKGAAAAIAVWLVIIGILWVTL